MIVRENIEFQRGLDPKKSLKLGIRQQILQYAQDKCKIEHDWSWSSPSGWLWEIQEDKDLSKETKNIWLAYLQENTDYLDIKMDEFGNIFESLEFERGIDPKNSMGLGIEAQIRSWFKKKAGLDFDRVDPATVIEYAVMDQRFDVIKYMVEVKKAPISGIAINIAMKNKVDKEIILYLIAGGDPKSIDYIKDQKRKGKNIISNKSGSYNIENIEESIQQFQRGLDPKKSMNIGLEETIRNYIEEVTNLSETSWISFLLDPVRVSNGDFEKIDEETKIKWIKFLIEKEEYNKDLDENDYYDLRKLGISWIPFLPFPDKTFKYVLEGNNYFIEFPDWSEWSTFFESGMDVSEKFIEAVLSGEGAEDYFVYESDAFEFRDLEWPIQRVLSSGAKLTALDEIKQKAIEMGADPSKTGTVKELFDEIEENDDLYELREALSLALMSAQEGADQSEAYHDLIKAIKNHYQIGDGGFIENSGNNFYKAQITKKGIEDFFYTQVTGDDKIKYYPPQYSYNATLEAEDLNDAILYRLEEL